MLKRLTTSNSTPRLELAPTRLHGLLGRGQVLVLRCDVTVGGDVISALAAAASAEAGLPPVRGILHAAGPQQGGTDEEGLTLEERRQRFLEAKVCFCRRRCIFPSPF